MIAGIGIATWLTIGYAALLLAVAYAIDAFARRTAVKVERHRSGGFVYHEDHDAWTCPQDQWLWPQVLRPGQPGHALPGQPVDLQRLPGQAHLHDLERGREVSAGVDTWPASEAARFHRGIALRGRCHRGHLAAAPRRSRAADRPGRRCC